MNKLKRILCGISGAILIIIGLTLTSIFFCNILSLCFYYKSISGLFHVSPSTYILSIVFLVLLVIPGIRIFSSKESARKLAIVIYGILTAWAAAFWIFLGYYWFSPITMLAMFLIPLFFLIVLLMSREEFEK